MTPLHSFGDFIRDLFLQIPLSAVRVLFVAVPVIVLVWVLTLLREETTPEDETGSRSSNLKIGAAVALGIQIVIYMVL
jgi:hypothetical protein